MGLFAAPMLKRKTYLVVSLVWISVLSALTIAFAFGHSGPFDQRTGAKILGIAMSMPWIAVLTEPFAAPFYLIAGAPDSQIAAISIGCWLGTAAFVVCLVCKRSARSEVGFLGRMADSILFSFAIFAVYILYLLFAVLVPFPSWSLTPTDPQITIADLHSHTSASHDGFATESQSLSLHKAAGDTVVAWTEHYPSARDYHRVLHRNGMDVIGGFEFIANVGDAAIHLVVVGAPPSAVAELNARGGLAEANLEQLIRNVHDSYRGAVLVVADKVTARAVDRLVELGVDGFEIANQGHVPLARSVLDAIETGVKTHAVSRIAVSDWHGWSTYIRTWTAFVGMSPHGAGEDVIGALRAHDSRRVVPIVAEMFYPPSTLRVIFAPFAEIARYGGELSAERLASWWIWSAIFVIWSIALRRHGFNPAGTALLAIMVGQGGTIIARGAMIISFYGDAARSGFSVKIGLMSIAAGVVAIVCAVIARSIVRQPICALSPCGSLLRHIIVWGGARSSPSSGKGDVYSRCRSHFPLFRRRTRNRL